MASHANETTREMYGAEREEVSESWLHTYDLSSTMIPNVSTAIDDEEHFCKLILYKEIRDSRYAFSRIRPRNPRQNTLDERYLLFFSSL